MKGDKTTNNQNYMRLYLNTSKKTLEISGNI